MLPDPRNYGEISLSQVVEKSSQVGISKLSLDIGHAPTWDVFNRFGLGQSTGTGFPGESGGLLPQRPRWRPIEQVTLAFGYGLTATPLQLARAYAVFANGGILPELSLLYREATEVTGTRVIDAEVAAQVRNVLHQVTGDEGTARKARIAGYEVGGKTGTVHKVGAGGYLDDQYVALFVGIAPISDPRFVTVVVLDRPKGDSYGGGAAAAPVFARVAAETLRLLGVAPTLAAPEEMLAASLPVAGLQSIDAPEVVQ
jgi:cell division protein FtsI (penicillin-binding protein 3)